MAVGSGMVRTLGIAFALMMGLESAAVAGEFKLGTPPVAVITIPDSWGPSLTDTGVEATSDDGDIYIGVEVTRIEAQNKGLADAMLAAFEWVASQGAKLDAPAQPTTGNFNTWSGLRSEAKGTDAEGKPTVVEVIGVPVNETTALVFTGWYVPGAEQRNAETIGKILQSIQPAK